MLFIFFIIFILLIIFVLISLFFIKRSQPLPVGSIAPEFSLLDDQGHLRSLNELRGKKVVLYFYPKDNTPGCTKQACSLRDTYDELKQQGIEVLGLSYDTPTSHNEFKKQYNLPFVLLSDTHHIVARNYGATTSFYGLWELPIPRRITYLINEEGRIVAILKNVDVSSHAQQIIQAFGAAQN